MIDAMLAAWVSVQEPGVVMEARTRRSGTEHELVVTGAGVEDGAEVVLAFHRLVRRFDWDLGRLGLAAAEDAPVRTLRADGGRFEHVERFRTPGLVEVRARIGSDGSRSIRKVWSVGGPVEAAASARSASRKLEAGLRMLRSALEDADVLGGPAELSPKRARDLKRRLDWRFRSLREDLDGSPFSASAEAAIGLAQDLEVALELIGSGQPLEGLVSNQGGLPFTWAGARAQVARIGTIAGRERLLLALDAGDALRLATEAQARAGDEAAWGRHEKSARRALEELDALLHETTSASEDEAVKAAGVEPHFGGLKDLVDRGRAVATCAGASLEDFETLSESLRLSIERAQQALNVVSS